MHLDKYRFPLWQVAGEGGGDSAKAASVDPSVVAAVDPVITPAESAPVAEHPDKDVPAWALKRIAEESNKRRQAEQRAETEARARDAGLAAVTAEFYAGLSREAGMDDEVLSRFTSGG